MVGDIDSERHGTPQGTLQITPLIPWRRRVPLGKVGRSSVRKQYYGDAGTMYAPAMWVRVRGALPLYVDLLGRISDRHAFGRAFNIATSELPRK